LWWTRKQDADLRTGSEILAISPRTVNKHLEQVFVKLGVENRAAATGATMRTLAR
jgi:DNA-binding CsgD family transcriptional regulator